MVTIARRKLLRWGAATWATWATAQTGQAAQARPAAARLHRDGYNAIPTAMYVWGQRSGVALMQSVCDYALRHHIQTLYVQIDSAFRTDLQRGKREAVDSIAVLRSSGLASHGLCGEPTWATRPDLSPTVGQLVDIHQRYGVFSGLHFDVEPHVLPEWDDEANRPGLMDGLAQFLIRARAAMPSTLQEQAVLHPKFCVIELPAGQMFLEAIAPVTDEVSLMAYRDTPQEQMEWAAYGYPSVEAVGLPWRMAVLTTRPASSISYYGNDAKSFKRQMKQLWSLMHPTPMPLRVGLAYEHHGTDSLGSIFKP